MHKILTHYHVNYRTMLLLPARHIDYQTIVLEIDRKLFIKETPLQLIKQACLDGGASYDGRRAAVMYQTHFARKVPIPISTSKKIYTFPTHAPNHFDCHWIFYHHIQYIQPHHDKSNPNIQSMVLFKNGQKLLLEQSYYSLDKQMQRTTMCILRHTAYLQSNYPMELV